MAREFVRDLAGSPASARSGAARCLGALWGGVGGSCWHAQQFFDRSGRPRETPINAAGLNRVSGHCPYPHCLRLTRKPVRSGCRVNGGARFRQQVGELLIGPCRHESLSIAAWAC